MLLTILHSNRLVSKGDLCITPLDLKTMGFFSVPRLPGWSFQQRIHGGVLPPPHCPDKSGPVGSPTDTLRKDSTLPPVTSKKSIVFLRMVKIARFFKGLEKKEHMTFVFFLDQISSASNLDLTISDDSATIYGYKCSTKYIYFHGWRVALLPGQFTVFDNGEKSDLFVKVVFTPGKEAGFNRSSNLVRLFFLNEEKPEPRAFTGHLQ
jgi:hypothetical protein